MSYGNQFRGVVSSRYTKTAAVLGVLVSCILRKRIGCGCLKSSSAKENSLLDSKASFSGNKTSKVTKINGRDPNYCGRHSLHFAVLWFAGSSRMILAVSRTSSDLCCRFSGGDLEVLSWYFVIFLGSRVQDSSVMDGRKTTGFYKNAEKISARAWMAANLNGDTNFAETASRDQSFATFSSDLIYAQPALTESSVRNET